MVQLIVVFFLSLRADALPSCADAGVLGVLPGIIGSLQALETIKIITGIGEVMTGRVLLYDALGQKFDELKLSADKTNQEITELQNYSFNIDCSTPVMKNPIEINEIDPADLLKKVDKNPNLTIIDVCEVWDRELECIQPSLHIPLGRFPSGNSTTIFTGFFG